VKVTVTVPPRLRQAAKESVQRALGALASVARDRLTYLAQERLKGSAQNYIKAISQPVLTERTAVITLNGGLVNMMEKGTPSFDIKKMLKGRKFVDVPFRHGVPGSSNAMPKADFNVMRQMAASAGAQATRVRGPKVMPTQPKTGEKVGRTSSMLRVGAVGHHQFFTFRRISKNSDPSSWIHPGFKALNIFPTVAREVQKIAPKVIADYLKAGI
jgi:hypothetical protein